MKITNMVFGLFLILIANTAFAQNAALNAFIGTYARTLSGAAGAKIAVTKIDGATSIKGFSNSTPLELTCVSPKSRFKLNLRLQGAQTVTPQSSRLKLVPSGSNFFYAAAGAAAFEQEATLLNTGEKAIARVSLGSRFTLYYGASVPQARVTVNNVSLFFTNSQTNCFLPTAKSFNLLR